MGTHRLRKRSHSTRAKQVLYMGFSQWETNAPRVGKTVISVFGAAIGVYDASARARIGATACLYTSWRSETQVACQVPAGRGLLLPTVVTVGVRKGTSSGVFSYNTPSVSMLVRDVISAGEAAVRHHVAFRVWVQGSGFRVQGSGFRG
jgi:hypothetical protein